MESKQNLINMLRIYTANNTPCVIGCDLENANRYCILQDNKVTAEYRTLDDAIFDMNDDAEIVKLPMLLFTGLCLIRLVSPQQCITDLRVGQYFYTPVNGTDIKDVLNEIFDIIEEGHSIHGSDYRPLLFIAHNMSYEINAFRYNTDILKRFTAEVIATGRYNFKGISWKIGRDTVAVFRDSKLLCPVGSRSLKKASESLPQELRKMSDFSDDFDWDTDTVTEEYIEYNKYDCIATIGVYMQQLILHNAEVGESVDILKTYTDGYRANLLPMTETSINKFVTSWLGMDYMKSQTDALIGNYLDQMADKPSHNTKNIVGRLKDAKTPVNYSAIDKTVKFYSQGKGLKINPKDEDDFKFMYKSAHGGMIISNPKYIYQPQGKSIAYDISSSYPSVAWSHYFPCGVWKKLTDFRHLNKDILNWAKEFNSNPLKMASLPHWSIGGRDIPSPSSAVLKVKIRHCRAISEMTPFAIGKSMADVKGLRQYCGKMTSCEEAVIYITREDFIIFLNFYTCDWEIIEALQYNLAPMPMFIYVRFIISFKQKYYFKKAMKYCEKGKKFDEETKAFCVSQNVYREFDTANEGVAYYKGILAQAKSRLNSQYGITYQTPLPMRYKVQNGDIVQDVPKYKNKSLNIYPIGMYIAQYGRINAMCYFQYMTRIKKHKWLYMHTDSIKFLYDDYIAIDTETYNIAINGWKECRPKLEGTGIFDHDADYDAICTMGNGRVCFIEDIDGEHIFGSSFTGIDIERVDTIRKLFTDDIGKKRVDMPLDAFHEICEMLQPNSYFSEQETGKTTVNHRYDDIQLSTGVRSFGTITETDFTVLADDVNANQQTFEWIAKFR